MGGRERRPHVTDLHLKLEQNQDPYTVGVICHQGYISRAYSGCVGFF